MKGLSEEDLQWNALIDLWNEGKLESPYSELVEYLNGVNGEGHFCHFDNISGSVDLKKYVSTLETILPEPLKSNIRRAYNAYSTNPDDIDDEDAKILGDCDEVYYKNEELVNKILMKRASKIKVSPKEKTHKRSEKKRIDEKMYIEIRKDVIKNSDDYGDSKKVAKNNRAITKIFDLINEIKDDKEYLTQMFSNLLKSEDEDLRESVAYNCLTFNVLKDEAVAVLKRVAKDNPNKSFIIEMVLKQHKIDN